MMLQPGSQIAHFKIVQKLGQGGMGAVYLAEDQKLHRQVALKTLSQEMFDNPEHKERFVREASTAAQVSHGNVMAIYDIDSATESASGKSIQYIVMEYIKGQSLTAYLRTSKIDMAGVVRLAEKIGAGLAAAHKLRIVHRDIKSDNILIDEQHEPKILDFGLAKPIDPVQMEGGDVTNTVSQELTRAGKILGTVSYMSPEQIKGEPVDTRSDIFSFGILLYRMATGESPFEGGTQVSTLAKILESAPEPPHVRNDQVPAELERIIDKCLQKDPNDRYQDTRDLVVDLRNLRKSYDSGSTDTVSVVRESAAKKARTKAAAFSLSWKGMTLAIFGMLLLFVVIMELIEGDGRPGRSSGALRAGETGIAILGFENQTKDTSLNWLGTGLPEILMTDLAENQSLRVISRQRLIDAVGTKGTEPTAEELRDAASELGASNLLTGTYFKLGDQVRIDARLEDLFTGNIVLAEKVIGADPFKLVDSLSQKVRGALKIGESAGGTSGVAQLTSSSPEAYKLYLAGMAKFSDGEYDSAIADFEKALKIDSALALAHMRIGMSLTFTGKQQAGMTYFAAARQFQDRLPVREKSLVDVYSNIWLDRRLADASTKLKAMVANYPDDKEVRAVYGIFLGQLQRDSVGALAQFDSALLLDPDYSFAISLYAQQYAQNQNWSKAVEWAQKLVELRPSARRFRSLAMYLSRAGRFDEAVNNYEKAIRLDPNDIDTYSSLLILFVRTGDLDKAEQLLPKEKSAAGEDPYRRGLYVDDESNLFAWRGKFREALRSSHEGMRQALKTKDSSIIFAAHMELTSTFSRLGMQDSVAKYSAESDKYANVFQQLSYPMQLIDLDPANEKQARPMLQERLSRFKERLPAQMWPLADALQKIFDGTAARDTSAMIAGLRELIQVQNQANTGNQFELGELLVKRGQFGEGKKELEPLVSGPLRSSSGLNYPLINYLLGIAEEGLGNRQRATEYFKEMLKYWGDADIQFKEITDAKSRLAKLTG